jgi:hypothetical protein
VRRTSELSEPNNYCLSLLKASVKTGWALSLARRQKADLATISCLYETVRTTQRLLSSVQRNGQKKFHKLKQKGKNSHRLAKYAWKDCQLIEEDKAKVAVEATEKPAARVVATPPITMDVEAGAAASKSMLTWYYSALESIAAKFFTRISWLK